MGVIHKLKPDIKDYVIVSKKNNPDLSCRKLSAMILGKFQMKLSKSSINALLKASGLSLPVGRRRKARRRAALEAKGLGAVLLKVADCLIGGSAHIAELIKNRFKKDDGDLLAKTEASIYSILYDKSKDIQADSAYGLFSLAGKKFSSADIAGFFNELNQAPALSFDISRITPEFFQEIRFIKLNLGANKELFLDGQLHTIWSTQYIPYDFSDTAKNLRHKLKSSFKEDSPLVLAMAPSYDIPTRELFDFIWGLDSAKNKSLVLSLYGNQSEEIDKLILEAREHYFFVFGLWPWQFVEYREVKRIGDFRPYTFLPAQEKFYIAEIELELLQPALNQKVSLKGCALKNEANGKVKLIILSNLAQPETNPEQLADIYLNHWPNLEEGFQDFSRKIELFTYTASSQMYFSDKHLTLDKQAIGDEVKQAFEYYLKVLDLYVRWHILPSGYENKDFSLTSERFYGLSAKIKKEKGLMLVTLRLPEGYGWQKDLEYACRRINEKGIFYPDGSRLWCRVA